MEVFLINFLCYLVEAIIMEQYASSMFAEKHSSRQRLSLLGGLYLAIFLPSLFEILWLNILLFLLVNFLFLLTQYKLTWYGALFHSALYTALMSVTELILYGLISQFTANYFDTNYITNKTILAIFSKLLLFLFVYLIIHISHKTQKNEQKDKSALLLLFTPLVSSFVMITFITLNPVPSSNEWMITLCAILLLAMNLLIFGINQNTQKKNEEHTQLLLLRQKEADTIEYQQQLLTQHQNHSLLIHDIKNHLEVIAALNKAHKTDQIDEYIAQLVQSSDLKKRTQFCNHEQLNLILSRYKLIAEKQKINFYTDIRSGSTDFISDVDLTSLFCNLLDNAVQAAGSMADAISLNPTENDSMPYIEITAVNRNDDSLSIITVVNSCPSNPFNNQGKLPTTKADKQRHGFGLKSIRKVVDKYNGNMKMYYHDTTQTFHTILTLTSHVGL